MFVTKVMCEMMYKYFVNYVNHESQMTYHQHFTHTLDQFQIYGGQYIAYQLLYKIDLLVLFSIWTSHKNNRYMVSAKDAPFIINNCIQLILSKHYLQLY